MASRQYCSGIIKLDAPSPRLKPMGFISELRALWDPETYGILVSPKVDAEQRRQTEALSCAASTVATQASSLIGLFSSIWQPSSERHFHNRLINWMTQLEQDAALRSRFQQSCKSMLASLDSVFLFAEAGIPAQHALFREITSRLFQHWLPPPLAENNTARLFNAVFDSRRSVERFLNMEPTVFDRLATIFWSEEGLDAYPQVHRDVHEALRLLAARVSARGTSRAVRQRIGRRAVEESPAYALVFATERLITCEHSSRERLPGAWLNSVFACRGEVALVRIHMEDAGANSFLVFDLGSMDAALDRMELLAGTLEEDAVKTPAAVRRLLNTLVQGQLEDSRVTSLVRRNFNLLARKTVERTGHGGEHYIAHSRKEY